MCERHEGNHHEESSHRGCCGGAGNGHTSHEVAVVLDDEVVTCAVKGNPTARSRAESDGLVRNHEGENYYFCCPHCADMFDAEPAAYATAP